MQKHRTYKVSNKNDREKETRFKTVFLFLFVYRYIENVYECKYHTTAPGNK